MDEAIAPPVAMQLDDEIEDMDAATTPGNNEVDSAHSNQALDVPKVSADDHEGMKAAFMPPLPDLQTADEQQFTWDITAWREMQRREHSLTFMCGGAPWKVLFFPWGNAVEYASFYLEQGFSDDNPAPEGWYACVQFLLVLSNVNDPNIYVQHSATHRFNAEEGDWGFTRFVELRKIFNNAWEEFDRPMIENNSARLTAYVRVVNDPTGVLWHSFLTYDSKKETGMVGLKNQGATCYLNSLLQSLYLTPAFRKAVYQIKTNTDESPKLNHAYALQRLFLQLQASENAVSTSELTQSFGWDTRQIFEQQDVQELERVLMERLEEKMKGGPAERALYKLFAGKTKMFVSCINVDFQSGKEEEFWDVQLNVTGQTGLDASFKDYIQVETLTGENKYAAEGHGLQDAEKGVIFTSFPPVLHLHLKRFEFDFNREQMTKINDRFEFPETWDAAPYLDKDVDRSEPFIYKLHGVLVHAGELHAGHYYAFLRPERNGPFYKFDDDRVTRATLKEAIDENFGGEYPAGNGIPGQRALGRTTKRTANAYMLVYIRESQYDKVLLESEDVDPPAPIMQKWEEERTLSEKRKKERDEAHLYMEVLVASVNNFRAYEGFDIVPFVRMDMVDEKAYPEAKRILKKTTVAEFLQAMADELNVPADAVRPWCMVGRQNGTVRPDIVLSGASLNMTMDEAAIRYGHKQLLRMWIEETPVGPDNIPVWGDSQVELHRSGDKAILLFLKCFDVEQQKLRGVGTFYASNGDKVQDLHHRIFPILGWAPGTSFRVYEEIKQGMIDPMKGKATLAQAELQDGDIIAVQKIAEIPAPESGFSSIVEYYDYVQYRVTVHFYPRTGVTEQYPQFDLVLTKRINYATLSQKAGDRLNVDPTHIRFFPVNANSGKPKAPIKYTSNYSLAQMLSQAYPTYAGHTSASRNDALYYEVLECSLQELENRKIIKVTYLPATDEHDKEQNLELLVPKTGNVEDMIALLQKKAGLDDETARRIRVYDVHNKKIHKDFPLAYPVTNFNDYADIIAEPRLEEEIGPLGEGERLISCFHFDREIGKSFGYPFVFLAKAGEVFKDTKERLSTRTGIKGKNLEKVKFAVVPRSGYGKAEPLNDEDILFNRIKDDDILGLDHLNKARTTPNRSDQIFIRD